MFFSKDSFMKENDLITIDPNDKYFAFVSKDSDFTCEIATKKNGSFKGIIENFASTGKYMVRILEILREDQ